MPNLPTDNLYKFLALSGVFLFCFAIYFTNGKTELLKNIIFEEEMKIDRLEISIKWNNNEIEYLLKKVNGLIEKRDGKYVIKNPEMQQVTLNAISENITKAYQDIQDKHLNILFEISKLKRTNQYTAQQLRQLDLYRIMRNILVVFSFFMSSIGFYLWYIRVQKPLDQAIKLIRSE